MNPVFIDTSALIAMGNKRDQFHRQAIDLRNQLIKSKRAHITTSVVLMELGNAFSPMPLRPTAIRLIETIKRSRFWQVIPIDDDLFDRGFAKFKQMTDKEWSLSNRSQGEKRMSQFTQRRRDAKNTQRKMHNIF